MIKWAVFGVETKITVIGDALFYGNEGAIF